MGASVVFEGHPFTSDTPVGPGGRIHISRLSCPDPWKQLIPFVKFGTLGVSTPKFLVDVLFARDISKSYEFFVFFVFPRILREIQIFGCHIGRF